VLIIWFNMAPPAWQTSSQRVQKSMIQFPENTDS
jgi:hypothetical protein